VAKYDGSNMAKPPQHGAEAALMHIPCPCTCDCTGRLPHRLATLLPESFPGCVRFRGSGSRRDNGAGRLL